MTPATSRRTASEMLQMDDFAHFGGAVFTSLWIPNHINPILALCSARGRMNGHEAQTGTCSCRAALPDEPA